MTPTLSPCLDATVCSVFSPHAVLVYREGLDAEELSMECLEQILRFHNKTQKCWLSQLHAATELSVFDLLVYLILYRVNSRPKAVLTSLKHHVRGGSLTASLVQVRVT